MVGAEPRPGAEVHRAHRQKQNDTFPNCFLFPHRSVRRALAALTHETCTASARLKLENDNACLSLRRGSKRNGNCLRFCYWKGKLRPCAFNPLIPTPSFRHCVYVIQSPAEVAQKSIFPVKRSQGVGNSDPSPGTSDWSALPELLNEKVSAITRDHGIVITTFINLDRPRYLGRSDFYFTCKLLEGISQSMLSNKFICHFNVLLHHWLPHSINKIRKILEVKLKRS